MAEQAVRRGALPENVSVVHNGVALEDFGGVTEREPVEKRKLEILFCGRLAPEKGVDVQLCSAARLGDIPFCLRIEGNGVERHSLGALTSQLKLDGKVIFEEHVERGKLGTFYRRADVVVIPSRSEALPLVALEASAAGFAHRKSSGRWGAGYC